MDDRLLYKSAQKQVQFTDKKDPGWGRSQSGTATTLLWGVAQSGGDSLTACCKGLEFKELKETSIWELSSMI